jgi:3-dehydroquinate synthase
MRKLNVNLNQNSYEIWIGKGILNGVGDQLQARGFRDKAVIITNPTVKALYGEALNDNLQKAGFAAKILEVPDGEENKSLEQAGILYYQLSDFQAERMTPIIALGGGVIGDLAGFVAATYMRGVPLFQVPTTLLAQVDSSIGGKVAVNHGQLKNNIGTFYQPKLVMSDISTLKTLPDKEILNGLAEVIKYGIIRHSDLFRLIDRNIEKLLSVDENLSEEVVYRCASIKSEIVEEDEKDLGLRNILNYGHTVGHAVETVSDFQIKHGQGVAVGMIAAAMISQKSGILSADEAEKIKSIISRAGLTSTISGLDVKKIMLAMQHDKKKAGGKIRLILLKTIGEVLISDETDSGLVEQVLRDLL